MIVPLLLSAIAVFLNLPSAHSYLAEGRRCLTPNYEKAICTKVNSCTAIKNAINTQSPEAVRFARESQCGYSTEPLVCCGTSGLFTTRVVYQHRLLPTPNNCGGIKYIRSNKHVHYGQEAGLREFRWMALLGYIAEGESKLAFQCGGSLINNRYVLTAAHCVKKRGQTLTTVRLGEHNTATITDCAVMNRHGECNLPAKDYEVEYAVKHPSYTNKQKANDIALVRLKSNVEFKDHIQPICLPASDAVSLMAGTTVIGAGWGETENGTQSSIKLKAKLKVIPLPECANTFKAHVAITDTQYCASGFCDKNGRKCADTCSGDSGGPSMRIVKLPSARQWIQEGITSFGVQICGQGYPAVYTQVSKYVQWIGDNMKD